MYPYFSIVSLTLNAILSTLHAVIAPNEAHALKNAVLEILSNIIIRWTLISPVFLWLSMFAAEVFYEFSNFRYKNVSVEYNKIFQKTDSRLSYLSRTPRSSAYQKSQILRNEPEVKSKCNISKNFVY